MMDSKLLRCFLSVIDHRNVTAAANALHLTQPALSKTIQKLESELGVRLFERRPGGVIPTEYGLALARRARLIEHEFRLASGEIQAMKDGGSGTITVGAGPLWTVHGLPEVLASLLEQKLKIKVRLLTGVLDTLIPDLLKGDVDIVCAALDFPDHPEVAKEHLCDVQHVVLGRADHPLAKRRTVQPQELLRYPWIAFANDYVGMGRIGSFFSANGLEQPTVAVETTSLEAMLSLLRLGEFVASVSAPLVPRAELLGLKSLPVGGTFWRFRAGIAYRRSSNLSPLTSVLIAALKAHFRTRSEAVSQPGARVRPARRNQGRA
jgi:DNA-binding transcriptional LysR family regulator